MEDSPPHHLQILLNTVTELQEVEVHKIPATRLGLEQQQCRIFLVVVVAAIMEEGRDKTALAVEGVHLIMGE